MTRQTLDVPRIEPAEARPAPPLDYDYPPRRSYGWVWLVLLAVIGAAVYWYFPQIKSVLTKGSAAPPAPPARSVPVVVATAKSGDMDIYLTGLGTVTAFNTVSIHTRVDGELDKVAFVEGQLVHKDDLLAEIDPRPFQVQLATAEAQLAKDQAALENAKRDLQRDIDAIEAIPRQQLDTQRAVVAQGEATVKGDLSQIQNAKLQLTYCRIIAPITGRIGLRLVDQGNIVHANDSSGLAVINQVQPISLVFYLPQDVIPQVQRAMKSNPSLTVQAWDRDVKRMLTTGTLSAIDSQIDPTSGTVRMKATVPNEGDELYPNQFVNARLLVETLKGVVLVPTAAVQRSPQSTFVYVVQPDETVMMTDVQVGSSEGDLTVIEDGLDAGDIVVIDGVDKLQDKTKVSVAKKGAGGKPGATTKPGAATQPAAGRAAANKPVVGE